MPRAAPRGDKPGAKPGGSAAEVSDKDQELDDLLQKLGETKDAPSPDDRPQGGAEAARTTRKASSRLAPEKPEPGNKLTGKDKETDEHLEELTGRRRKRKSDDGQRSGKVGEMIKEMKDVEQKLGKPDTGEGTREQQKKIVKRIETMIEQAKKSGSSMGRMMVRRVRKPGNQQGQQGQTPGAMARGASATKPLPPTGKHSTAGGKDIWGHLPPELRQEIENSFKEDALDLQVRADRALLSLGRQGQARTRGVRSCSAIGEGGCAASASSPAVFSLVMGLVGSRQGAGRGQGAGQAARGVSGRAVAAMSPTGRSR